MCIPTRRCTLSHCICRMFSDMLQPSSSFAVCVTWCVVVCLYTECRFKSHRRCAPSVSQGCKWTTRESIERDGERTVDNVSTPHTAPALPHTNTSTSLPTLCIIYAVHCLYVCTYVRMYSVLCVQYICDNVMLTICFVFALLLRNDFIVLRSVLWNGQVMVAQRISALEWLCYRMG